MGWEIFCSRHQVSSNICPTDTMNTTPRAEISPWQAVCTSVPETVCSPVPEALVPGLSWRAAPRHPSVLTGFLTLS